MCWKEGSETVFTLTLDCNKYIIIIVFLSEKMWRLQVKNDGAAALYYMQKMERCSYENDVSTKKTEAQPRSRLYEENENESRQERSQEKAGKRQESAVRVSKVGRAHVKKEQRV